MCKHISASVHLRSTQEWGCRLKSENEVFAL
jgi:hypothetical protein